MTYKQAMEVAEQMNAHGYATLIAAYNVLYAAGNSQACDAIMAHLSAEMH